MRRPIPAADIISALQKTGFPLEHELSTSFREARWTVLSGRYYVDDRDGSAREMDLVAYKIVPAGKFDVVTTVLVSCKKDEVATWALLSRAKPPVDPNVAWNEVHWWTDIEPLRSFLNSATWKDRYLAAVVEAGVGLALSRDIFAFQLVNPPGEEPPPPKNPKAKAPEKKPASPGNDTAIFGAITGLLKALSYEIEALPQRVSGRRRLYVFSLVVAVDAPLVEVRYDNSPPDVTDVKRITHLARYMIKQKHFSARVHFVQKDEWPKFLKDLTALAKQHKSFFGEISKEASRAIGDNAEIQKHFSPRLKSALLSRVIRSLHETGSTGRPTELYTIGEREGVLQLVVNLSESDVRLLNLDDELLAETQEVLLRVADYAGQAQYTGDDDEIPF